MDATVDAAAAPRLSRKQMRRVLDRYRVTDGKGFRLADFDPADTAGHLLTRRQADIMLAADVHRLVALQEKLYAQDEWAVLCVLQAMDAAGKDGTIKHVMSGVNPQGVQVTSFKAPGPRGTGARLPVARQSRRCRQRGHIGIFNRSHYEEVLVVRVHPEMLEQQHLPKELIGKRLWDQRLEAIAGFERYLTRQGTVVLKFFLNVSKRSRSAASWSGWRRPTRTGSSARADLAERAFWDEYQDAYQEAIAATATPHAPWFVVPADNKWFTRLIVVAAMIEAIESLDLNLPPLTAEQETSLEAARRKLESEPD